MTNTIVITEDISHPIDEGIKKYSFYLVKYFFSKSSGNRVFATKANEELPAIETLPKNKLLISLSFIKRIRKAKATQLVYVPTSSSTLMSFLRLRLISFFAKPQKVVMISVQERNHNYISKCLISKMKPNQIIVLSNKQAVYYQKIGLDSKVSPIGVDTNKFKSVAKDDKLFLRQKLHLPVSGKIALHVGHINKGRNIGIMKCLIKAGFQVVVIGSTRFESDYSFKSQLENEGFIFVNHYIDKIEEYYQASDIYVFPVQSATSAMEFPLSVLEAMACNIPIVTTRFGGLENFFNESIWFRYFSNEQELLTCVQSFPVKAECNNRADVIASFTWDKIFSSTFQN